MAITYATADRIESIDSQETQQPLTSSSVDVIDEGMGNRSGIRLSGITWGDGGADDAFQIGHYWRRPVSDDDFGEVFEFADSNGMSNPINLSDLYDAVPERPELSAAPMADASGLEAAIRNFFNNLDELGKEVTNALTQMHLPPWVLTAAGFAMVAEVSRRRALNRRQRSAQAFSEALASSTTWYPGILGLSAGD